MTTCPNCERLESERALAVTKNVALMGQVKELQAEIERLRMENGRLLERLSPEKTPIMYVNGNSICRPATPALQVHLTGRVLADDEAAGWLRKRRTGESET